MDYGTHYLIKHKDNKLWNFISDDEGNINYKILNEDNNEENQTILITGVKEEFGICMDESYKLHLVCTSYSGEIIYMGYIGGQWSRHSLPKWDPCKYSIRYPSIVVLDNKIHIILAIANLSNKGHWCLYHYCWNDNAWEHGKVAQFETDQDLSPFYMDIYNNDIHLTYGGLLDQQIKTFHIKYQSNLNKWLRPNDHKTKLPNETIPYIEENDEKTTNSQTLESDISQHMGYLSSKVENAYKEQISIVREADELRRRSMESKRQWELIIEELDELKIPKKKLKKKNTIGSFFKAILS
ncbi:MAG TPA: hypothetical protein VFD57_04130 [Clostridia bacterium]|nr:hypothetical protein [Clostridia bacterium]